MSDMNTFTGKRFDPMKMTTEDIAMEDIAHALSLLCRGGGHLKYFYSVGQHSVNCMKEARARGYSVRLQFACLLHDASEAYISDIIRPVKGYLTNYLEIEDMIMQKIWNKFNLGNLTEEEHRKWKQIDDEILDYELKELVRGQEDRVCKKLYSSPDLTEKRWEDVAVEFLALAGNLMGHF